MSTSLFLTVLSLWSSLARAQFPPAPEGVTTVWSTYFKEASLSYKQTSICETTPGVKAYSGFINLPPTLTGENFTISTFYWFFEARKNPTKAPFAIYLSGGPGESSMDGATGDGGPCNINADSKSTSLNPWSFNSEVNMIYIDQPVQTGFSYDTLVNGTYDLIANVITPRKFSPDVEVNETTIWGTFPSQDPTKSTLGSERGASALWHFMQVFVADFPKINMDNKKISMWGNSWAGFYITTTFAFFERQNRILLKGKPVAQHRGQKIATKVLPLEVMGTTNGCMDLSIEAPHYPEMATNNTYGFVAYNQTVYKSVLEAVSQCQDLLEECRSLAAVGDPDYNGNNATVNTACSTAFGDCFQNVQGPFELSGRSASDMSHPLLDPFPAYLAPSYFNQGDILSDLGVPLNFSWYGLAPETVYAELVGDGARANISSLEYVLQSGYRVAMVHGDRDFRCNWLGGEAISLRANWTHAPQFRESGYANVVINDSNRKGFVRQAGSFSFTRIFQGGHDVQAFQPQAVGDVFKRAMFGLDIATGKEHTSPRKHSTKCEYTTTGPSTVRGVNEQLPPPPPVECYIWNAESRCTPKQLLALANGTAVVKDFIVVSPAPEEG